MRSFKQAAFVRISLLVCFVGVALTQTAIAQVAQIAQPLVPSSTAPGNPGPTVTVNGTGFVPGSVVEWNGSPRSTTFVSSKQLTAAITAGDVASPGTASVTVSNPGPPVSTSNVAYFEITNATASVSFGRTDYTVGADPVWIATADFNGDGKLDLVVANSSDNDISVMLGNGDGTFQAPHTYATACGPSWVAVGDFNGDGKLDLAVASANQNCPNISGNGLSILLGNGDGTFRPSVFYAGSGFQSGVQSVAVGNFNGDGKLDLAVTNYNSFTVSIFMGNGDGTFQRPVDYRIGSFPRAVVASDFNGDGKLDLATANQDDGTVSILFGNGDGTFQSAVTYPAGDTPQAIATADLNGDGKPDLVVANQNGDDIGVMLGNGDGTFRAIVRYALPDRPQRVTIADLNGDGIPDLVVGYYACPDDLPSPCADNLFSILLGNGDGTFQAPTNLAGGTFFETAPVFAAGDFNGDGRMDLAEPLTLSNNISVLLQPPPAPANNTPTGSSILVNLDGGSAATGGASVTFSNVTQSGNTSEAVSGTGAPPPAGFKLGTPPTYFDLSTTASYSGPITVCINYGGISFGNLSKLRLFHFENGAWVNVTTNLNTSTMMICGGVTSLSPFAIFEYEYSAAVQAPINADGSSVFNANRGVVPVKFTATLNGAPTCALPAAMISVFSMSGGGLVTVNQSEYIMPADSGTSFRIDTTSCQYVYNLDAKTLGPGKYTIDISNGDIVIGTAVFALQ